MRARFLLGPAGTGKTYRCLEEIRHILSRSPEGPPLILLAPDQTTYQLERQLLAGKGIHGYTRLYILSFKRLAYQLYDWLGAPCPELLDDEGRVMVLRALLMRRQKDLKLFRASARLTGFARQLSGVLREFQQGQISPECLAGLAGALTDQLSLAHKLQDFALLLHEYTAWLHTHKLQDSDCLLSNATRLMMERGHGPAGPGLHIEGLWVDGFAEFTDEELGLLAALLPACRDATITFCLEDAPRGTKSWLSGWSVSRRALENCRQRLAQVCPAGTCVEKLARDPLQSRFAQNLLLGYLEQHWTEARPAWRCPEPGENIGTGALNNSLRVAVCANPGAEVTLAAREILDHVRNGGRYRDVTVLVRNLDGYHHEFERVFTGYEIPYFLDRRESMAHHPVAELTRSALRVVALGWQHEDWFAALKTGLIPTEDEAIDRLENEALARGWRGSAWQLPLQIKEAGRTDEEERRLRQLESELEALRQKIIAPFQKLALALRLADNQPVGKQLATALREFWAGLNIAQQLETLGSELQAGSALQETVWSQINSWADNIELAFSAERVALRDWLPILEAGLANLTVGSIPPALDQVLVGPVDRSRNPESRLALVLGLNEGVFPAVPGPGGLLTESDRVELERRNVLAGSTTRQQLSRERYYAYIACTRARHRLVLTCALRDQDGHILNPSPFLTHIRRLCPSVEFETAQPKVAWPDCRHAVDLIEALPIQFGTSPAPQAEAPAFALRELCDVPRLSSVLKALEQLQFSDVRGHPPALNPEVAARLYGPVLRTSVSRMEQFAACPFKFFVHSGLRAQERKQFELDSREQGSFQHDVLALFHEQLRQEHKHWRDITPAEARERVGRISQALVANYREGLLESTEQTRFMARILTESLQDFVEIAVDWMRQQYRFTPVAVELPFGGDPAAPPWSLDLGNGQRLELYGRIDRVDLFPASGNGGKALCVVVDYKSGHRQLDPVLIAHGLQLQLLAYLNVLRHWPNPDTIFGASRLIPAGVFYVNLRGKTHRESNRTEALADTAQARKLAYRHSGRFDAGVLSHLDGRPGVQHGDQFNYRLTKDGVLNKACREPVGTDQFVALLDTVETRLRTMGRQIYEGVAEVSPFRKNTLTACQQCDYHPICRVDPWIQRFRVLKGNETGL